jgi:hypothetical protein
MYTQTKRQKNSEVANSSCSISTSNCPTLKAFGGRVWSRDGGSLPCRYTLGGCLGTRILSLMILFWYCVRCRASSNLHRTSQGLGLTRGRHTLHPRVGQNCWCVEGSPRQPRLQNSSSRSFKRTSWTPVTRRREPERCLLPPHHHNHLILPQDSQGSYPLPDMHVVVDS